MTRQEMIQKNIPLKNHSSYKIGGPAKLFAEFSSAEELKKILGETKGEKILVLGGGTNILFDDRGFSGLVLKNKITTIEEDGKKIKFGAGVPFGLAVARAAKNSLSGFEWAGGLPGTVGGAVRGNAGSFGGETKDNLLKIESYNLITSKLITRTKAECKFGYRTSIFKTPEAEDEIILSATFEYKPGDQTEIKKIVAKNAAYRREKQPKEPGAGSTFKNIPLKQIPDDVRKKFNEKIKNDPFPQIPAAVFIAEAGLVGKTVGRAKVSEVHPNFLVNAGHAKSEDVKKLIKLVQDEVFKEFKVKLAPEIEIVEY